MMRVLVGCEHSGVVRRAFRARGHDAWSCDLLDATDNSEHHIKCDVLTVLDEGWDLAIFHPDCTFQTCSAEWAYKDPDYDRYPGVGYHQRVEPNTLTGAARRAARAASVEFCRKLLNARIRKIAMENPKGHLSSAIRPSDQTIQPYWFGDDASKATCLWLKNLPKLRRTHLVIGRRLDDGDPDLFGEGGTPRWSNQTDSGQNNLSPGADRWSLRAETYPGIANAMADQWGQTQ